MTTSSNENILLVTGHLCGEFTGHRWRPVTRSFDIFFDRRLNKRLRKQSWGWWFETPLRPLWRHCYAFHSYFTGTGTFALLQLCQWSNSKEHTPANSLISDEMERSVLAINTVISEETSRLCRVMTGIPRRVYAFGYYVSGTTVIDNALQRHFHWRVHLRSFTTSVVSVFVTLFQRRALMRIF